MQNTTKSTPSPTFDQLITEVEQESKIPLTETSAFKDWFENSKVTEGGIPLVVYHGTAPSEYRDFPKNGISEFMIPSYFSDNLNIGNDYISYNNQYKKGAQIYPVYLSIKNPYFTTEYDDLDLAYEDNFGGLAEKGYDGIIYRDENNNGDIYVAFKQEQIKSIHNRGTFSLTNPNILYSGFDPTFGIYNDTPALIDLNNVINKLKELTTKPREAIPHLVTLGKTAYQEGYASPKRWLSRMNDYLAETWHSFKSTLQTIYTTVKQEIIHARETIKYAINNQRGSFAGPNALTADHIALNHAKQLAEGKVHPDIIRKETGYFQGLDGKWRFEIDDSKIERLDSVTQWLKKAAYPHEQGVGQYGAKLDEVIKHDKLFAAYPELRKVNIVIGESRGFANYHPKSNTITFNEKEYPINGVWKRENAINFIPKLLHEIQHVIQEREGFARGGSLQDGLNHARKQAVEDVEDLPAFMRLKTEKEKAEFIDQFVAMRTMSGTRTEAAHIYYNRLAGEIESNDVAKRTNFSAKDREENSPNLPNDAIITFKTSQAASYAGPHALTANHTNLAEAKRLHQEGVPSETIRQETGFFRSMDGKWRFEINDSKLICKNNQLWINKAANPYDQGIGNFGAKLSEVIEHDNLFRAYPELKNINVAFLPTRGDAGYNPSSNTIILNEKTFPINGQWTKEIEQKFKKSLLHEIQHTIQEKENFARGASVSELERMSRAEHQEDSHVVVSLAKELKEIHSTAEYKAIEEKYWNDHNLEERNNAPAMKKSLELGQKLYDIFKKYGELLNSATMRELETTVGGYPLPKPDVIEKYLNYTGEIEARDTANRQQLSEEERKNIAPDLPTNSTISFKSTTAASYAGPHALTAKHQTLSEAKQLASEGINPETIRQTTSWHQSMDKKWRFEIDDSQAKWVEPENFMKLMWSVDKSVSNPAHFMYKYPEHEITLKYEEQSKNLYKQKILGDILNHPTLYAAYPEIQNIKIKPVFSWQNFEAGYSHEHNTIRLKDTRDEETLKNLLHEIQHAIQDHEHFARGGSVAEFTPKDITHQEIQKIETEIRTLLDENPDYAELYRENNRLMIAEKNQELSLEREQVTDKLMEFEVFFQIFELQNKIHHLRENPIIISPYDQYNNLAGEIEARDAASRLNLTESQRTETPPNLPNDATIIFSANHHIAANEILAPQQSKIDAIMNVAPKPSILPQNHKDLNPIREYQNQAQKLLNNGHAVSTIDLPIVTSMIQKKYKPHEITKALTASPNITLKYKEQAKTIISEASKIAKKNNHER